MAKRRNKVPSRRSLEALYYQAFPELDTGGKKPWPTVKEMTNALKIALSDRGVLLRQRGRLQETIKAACKSECVRRAVGVAKNGDSPRIFIKMLSDTYEHKCKELDIAEERLQALTDINVEYCEFLSKIAPEAMVRPVNPDIPATVVDAVRAQMEAGIHEILKLEVTVEALQDALARKSR